MVKKNNDLLGKGIRSLLQNIDTDLKTTSGNLKTEIVEKVAASQRVSLDKIVTNPAQPRKDFDETALSELAASVKMHNIIQPLTVSPLPDGKFKLIAGERRYRAAKIAGLRDVPVFIRETAADEVLELALLENLQRENLNAIEIGLSYKRLMEDLDYTQDKVAERMGKERSTVANYIRLLRLPPDIQVAVRNSTISMGHARALINVDAVDRQLFIFSEIKSKELSVRQTEDLVRRLYTGEAKNGAAKAKLSPSLQRLQDSISSQYGTKVKFEQNKKGNGSIRFEFFSKDELEGLLKKLNVKIG